MAHWRAVANFKHGYTALVFDGLDAALKAIQEDYKEWPDPADFINEASDHVIGLGLVAAQNYLSEVPLIVRESHASDESVKPLRIWELLRDYGRPVPGTSLRDMECVSHLANYWKHLDEWDADWSKEADAKQNSRR
jgi:hypothetical protein